MEGRAFRNHAHKELRFCEAAPTTAVKADRRKECSCVITSNFSDELRMSIY